MNVVKELYNDIPEFEKLTDHSNDEYPYIVFGELSILLCDEIKNNIKISDLTRKCFLFFNKIGNKKDLEIDNLLIVGIYEGLYANKKCNDVSRQLLSGRNKEVYEYWMINGNICSDY